ncbi:hypothetical protein U1Q18_029685, partial [Sarracenia purpurea var. burkii]
PNSLVDNIPVPDPVQAVAAASSGDETRQRRAGSCIGDDGGSGMFSQQDGRHQRDQLVAVDGISGAVDNTAAIDVSVEDNSKIGGGLKDGGFR